MLRPPRSGVSRTAHTDVLQRFRRRDGVRSPAGAGRWAGAKIPCPGNPDSMPHGGQIAEFASAYLLILVTRPAPTVRPPSRMANRRPSSMATG